MHPANKWLIGVIPATLISGAALLEGTRYYAYNDLAGIPTVCMGYTGKGIVFGKKYTHEECVTFLKTELTIHANGVIKCVNQPLKENEFVAFTLMAYNIGVQGFCGSRALKLFNEGRTAEACKAMAFGPSGKPAWSYVGDKFVQGLHNRRLYEMRMCYGNG